MAKRKSGDYETGTETVIQTTRKKLKVTSAAMPKEAYTPQQKSCIAEFTSFTQADKTAAAKVLKQHNWNTQAAINAYFNNPNGGASNPLRSTLSKTFDKYRDQPKENPDEVGLEGTANLLGELEIDLSHVDAFIFSEIVQSPSLGTITREGFVDGFSDSGADTIPKMRNVVLQRRSQLQSEKAILKDVYNHAFVLGLQDRQKALPMDVAMDFWKVLLVEPSWEWKGQKTPWLEWWQEFYEAKVKKAVNKDLWKQTLNFALETMKDEEMGFWSEESSWPSVIDEFVEWVREKRSGAGGEAMDTA